MGIGMAAPKTGTPVPEPGGSCCCLKPQGPSDVSWSWLRLDGALGRKGGAVPLHFQHALSSHFVLSYALKYKGT